MKKKIKYIIIVLVAFAAFTPTIFALTNINQDPANLSTSIKVDDSKKDGNDTVDCNSVTELVSMSNDYYKILIAITCGSLALFTMMDFFAALTSEKLEEKTKKAWSNFIKRTAITVIIILLPTILRFVWSVFHLSDYFGEACLTIFKSL